MNIFLKEYDEEYYSNTSWFAEESNNFHRRNSMKIIKINTYEDPFADVKDDDGEWISLHKSRFVIVKDGVKLPDELFQM